MSCPDRSTYERWADKVLIGDDCWEWTAAATPKGYGQLRVTGKAVYAHRLAYQFFRGPVPRNLCVLHHCDNPRCVKPSHLFLGTIKDNAEDMVRKGRCRDNRGENAPSAKLTWENVGEMRNLRGVLKQKDIAEAFGVHPAHVSKILSNKKWVQ